MCDVVCVVFFHDKDRNQNFFFILDRFIIYVSCIRCFVFNVLRHLHLQHISRIPPQNTNGWADLEGSGA